MEKKLTTSEIIRDLKEASDFFNVPDSQEFKAHSKYAWAKTTSKTRRSDVKIERNIYATLRYCEGASLSQIGEEVNRDHATILNSLRFVHTDFFYDTRVKERIERHFSDAKYFSSIFKKPTLPYALSAMDVMLQKILGTEIKLTA